MTPKERAAMQQALGALVRAEAMYGQPNTDIQTALREALAEQAELEPVAQQDSDDKRLLREIFMLCEATEELEPTNDFMRGRIFEAKGIRRSIGTWYQDTFCGRSYMGEPVLNAAPVQQAEQEPVARVTGYYGGRCVIEPINGAMVLPKDMALYAEPVEPVKKDPVRFVWNGEGWIEADDYIWKTTDDHERRELYAEPVQEPSISDGLCGGCAKKSADGWALYCVECWEKGNGQFASNEPAANAHVSNADSDILSDVKQEPFAYEVWDENDQVLILIYASYLKEAPWLEEDDIIRKLYAAPVEPVKQEPVAWMDCYGEVRNDRELSDLKAAGSYTKASTYDRPLFSAPVRTKDLTDDEIDALVDSACDSQMPMDMFARAVIQEYRRKNGIV